MVPAAELNLAATDVLPPVQAAADVPRLLLLSDEGPKTSRAGALLLFRMLKDYPSARLRVIERQIESAETRHPAGAQALTTPWRRFETSRFHRWKRSLRAIGLVPDVQAFLDSMNSSLPPSNEPKPAETKSFSGRRRRR